MIQTNELRRGNFIASAVVHKGKTPSGLTGPFRINVIKENSVLTTRLADGLPFELFEFDANPIPLTPKILEAAGFQSKGTFSGATLWKGNFFLRTSDWKEFFFSWERRKETLPGTRFKFLHELQNLFFALTGKELTIKF